MEENEHKQDDSPVRFKAKVLRVNSQGIQRPVPVVAQATLDGSVEFQAPTGGRLKKVGGIEAETIQATLEGSVHPQVARTANRQRRAIASHSAR